MKHETAGDPMTGLKWTRKATRKIAKALRPLGIRVCANTVGRLLKQMRYSLRVNRKCLESGRRTPPDPKRRNRQFGHIRKVRERFADAGQPIVSVDTKKKELIGNFKNPGRAWAQAPRPVYDHDFRSDASGISVPYGLFDPQHNRGCVFVGMSHDTPEFAVECIGRWWKKEGAVQYPHATELLILADAGGSNSPRSTMWKWGLQHHLCTPFGLTVTVCHYPPGASKWNPIEHRLFSEISKNWAGQPLVSFDKMLNYIRTTRTESGLRVTAHLVRKRYEQGQTISPHLMRQLALSQHDTLPEWNYTLTPAPM